MQDLLPEVDWVISVDGDTLWQGDPWELLLLRDDTKLYLTSLDPPDPNGKQNPVFRWFSDRGLKMDPRQYYCVGCQLMNLRRLRQTGFSKKALDFLECFPDPAYPEQMVMCYLAQGEMSPLPPHWGIFSFYHTEIDVSRPCLIHYVQDAPWQRRKLVNLMSDSVLVWHRFAADTLGLNTLEAIPLFSRFWRRALFVALKKNQWVLHWVPILGRYFKNTKGL